MRSQTKRIRILIFIQMLFVAVPWISHGEEASENLIKIFKNGTLPTGGRPIVDHIATSEQGGILGCGVFGDPSSRLAAENSFQLTDEIPALTEETDESLTVNSKNFRQIALNLSATCKKGSLVELRAQGISPLLTDLDTKSVNDSSNYIRGTYAERGWSVVFKLLLNFKSYLKPSDSVWDNFLEVASGRSLGMYTRQQLLNILTSGDWRNDDVTYRYWNPTYLKNDLQRILDSKHKEGKLLSTGTYSIHDSQVALKLRFLNFLKGGSAMRIEMLQSIEGMTVPLHENALLLRNNPYVSWVGNFDLVGCTQEGKAANSSEFKTLKSISELTTRVDEMTLPEGMTTCNFRAPVMTSLDRTQWNDYVKQIIPTLRNVNLSLDLVSANIAYEAYNGIQFGLGEQVGTKPIPLIGAGTVNWAQVEKLNSVTDVLLETLRGVVPVITQKDEKECLPAVIRYFTKHRPKIHELLTEIDALSQDEKIPFLSLLNVLRTLNKTYETLDQALGLVSSGEVKLGELLVIQK